MLFQFGKFCTNSVENEIVPIFFFRRYFRLISGAITLGDISCSLKNWLPSRSQSDNNAPFLIVSLSPGGIVSILTPSNRRLGMMHRSRMLGILFEHGVRTVSQLDVHSYWQFIAEDLRWRIAVRQLRSFLPQFSSSPSMSSFFSIIYSTHFAVTSPIAMKIKTKDSSRFQGHSFTLSSGIFCGIDSLAGTCLVSHSVSRTFLLLRICRLCVSFVT